MNERWSLRQRGNGLVEATLLLLPTAIVQRGRVQVSEDPRRPRALEELAMLRHDLPAHPGARHPGVDLQMPGTSGSRPRLDHRRIAERGRQVGSTQRVDLRSQDRREDEDRAADPAIAAKLLAAFLAAQEMAIKQALLADNLKTARKLVNGGSNGLDRFIEAYSIGNRRIA